MRGTWLVMVGLTVAAGRVAAQDHARTPLYDNLGSYHMAITTRSPVAQQYFDQGLRLTYGFNHDEAVKSYREAIREDSTCAMCWWGVALALGPNINLPMDTAVVRPAWEAVQQAARLAPGATPRERALHQGAAGRGTRRTPRPPAHRSTPPGPGPSARSPAAFPRTTTPPRSTPKR